MEEIQIDVPSFEKIQLEMITEDERRENLIKRSRDVLKASKNAIYSLHRNDVERASQSLDSVQSIIKNELLPLTQKFDNLRFTLSSCLEEFVEAVIFLGFLRDNRIVSIESLEFVTKEEYLGGIMDFTGELSRFAVIRATARDLKTVIRCKNIVELLYSQLMLFDFRNGNLRRKFDAVKYTLKKLEQLIYELTLSSSSGSNVVVLHGSGEPEPVAEFSAESQFEDGGRGFAGNKRAR